ncbi:DUF998 domain-containing protein [Azotobacter chroococcum subsp. isscasi]|uniref:DUF998 domain-containing protein n=1 Tax=Azotobacter chroococcum TaxID=353 RepID=UPI00103EA8E8|nr:DUF998 domain-containing protein [Azotobacter chroococcum]TBW06685.1 DUF998 domain-containing protein [Azotobacter chroococcum subsp. isscasi]
MDNNNKDPGGNLALWLPGGAVIISLVVSTFALTRVPLIESRPAGAEFHIEQQIEARLWQDPFDALERYRKNYKDNNNSSTNFTCKQIEYPAISPTEDAALTTSNEKHLNYLSTKYEHLQKIASDTNSESIVSETDQDLPLIIVALVDGGPHADQVELRRRIRYAILAGLKNSKLVPEDAQHIGCMALSLPQKSPQNEKATIKNNETIEIPFETFIANPFAPPTESIPSKAIVYWLKEEYLKNNPLQKLVTLHKTLNQKHCSEAEIKCVTQLEKQYTNAIPKNGHALKVIGPSSSKVLRDIYLEPPQIASTSNIEIYSPLATTETDTLTLQIHHPSKSGATSHQDQESQKNNKTSKKSIILRTISDDAILTRLLLEELKRRRVDPAYGLSCSTGAPAKVGLSCSKSGWRNRYNRIALVSEWDSLYSRALAKTFKEIVLQTAEHNQFTENNVNHWVLQFSYLRGLDGQLPKESASSKKSGDKENTERDGSPLDIGLLEKADGNSQLDYLRRLAEHIAERDDAYRRKGESGIGAIGVLGTDAYDKLLVLQALKSRMPNKVFFSTDLDARMLQRDHAETVRNLVLAAPYGLTLTRELQQDVPPFRDSLQSSVFVAVLVALAPQSFEEKRAKFDYSNSGLLSPGIYEIGIHGFIPLASSRADVCRAGATVRSRASGDENAGKKPSILQLPCLQDQPPPPYPELSETAHDTLGMILSMWWAKPLSLLLLTLAIFLGWWWTAKEKKKEKEENVPDDIRDLLRLVHNLPLALYLVAALSALSATWLWRVEFLWATFLPLLLGIICSKLISRKQHDIVLFNSLAYYIIIPIVVFLLALLWAYQQRRSLTEYGLGEPMFLFEGISAWPTLGLRLLAVLISISALAWGWRNLRNSKDEIEKTYCLDLKHWQPNLWTCDSSDNQYDPKRPVRDWLVKLGYCLFRIFFPLSPISIAKPPKLPKSRPEELASPSQSSSSDVRPVLDFEEVWKEHLVCGTFTASMLRASLAAWIFIVVTSALFIVWPMEGIPMRGELQIGKLGWMVPALAFQLLVFWVVDANYLLVRFIRLLSSHRICWPTKLQKNNRKIFGIDEHPCIDARLDMTLIAQRSKAVSRLIYAPTLVLLILIVSRSSVFDNWSTPPSMIISFLLTALVLFVSALSLRRTAEKARVMALERIDKHLLETEDSEKSYAKLSIIRERIATLNTGAFSRYSEDPLVRALLLSLAGIGGSAIVEVLNYSKF